MSDGRYKSLSTEELDSCDRIEISALYRNLLEQARRANALAAMVQHALELGHLGEGSTATWARKALASYLGDRP